MFQKFDPPIHFSEYSETKNLPEMYPGLAYILLNPEYEIIDGELIPVICDLYAVADEEGYAELCKASDEAEAKGDLVELYDLPSAPPEAYAAFIRLYSEWMRKEEQEQIDIVKKGVVWAKHINIKYGGSVNSDLTRFGKEGSALYGAEFDEYVNESWALFSEHCSNVDEFVLYLQKDLNKHKENFEKMRDRFLDEVFNTWYHIWENATNKSIAISTIQESYALKKKEFEKKVDEFYSGNRALKNLFRKYAQNMMSRLIAAQKKIASEGSEDIEGTGNLEENMEIRDTVDRIRDTLDDTNKIIMDLCGEGYLQKEIAEKLKISDAAVSKRMKKIKAALINAQLDN